MSEIRSYQIIPTTTIEQSGGNFGNGSSRLLRIIKIFLTLFVNNSFDSNLHLLREDGTPNDNAKIEELLELTQTKNDRLTGLEDFVNQLIKSNIDLKLIINSNIRERIRAARNRGDQENGDENTNGNDSDNDGGDDHGGNIGNSGNTRNNADTNDAEPMDENERIPDDSEQNVEDDNNNNENTNNENNENGNNNNVDNNDEGNGNNNDDPHWSQPESDIDINDIEDLGDGNEHNESNDDENHDENSSDDSPVDSDDSNQEAKILRINLSDVSGEENDGDSDHTIIPHSKETRNENNIYEVINSQSESNDSENGGEIRKVGNKNSDNLIIDEKYNEDGRGVKRKVQYKFNRRVRQKICDEWSNFSTDTEEDINSSKNLKNFKRNKTEKRLAIKPKIDNRLKISSNYNLRNKNVRKRKK